MTVDRVVRDEALAYLASHNVVTLATLGPDGLWAAAVFYVNDGFTLYFLSAPTTRHGRDLAEDPRVAGTVHEDYRAWPDIKGIQFEGRVEALHGVDKLKAVALYGHKYPFVGTGAPIEIAKALSSIEWYQIIPEHLFFIDNSLGLGHREEITPL